MKSTKSSSPFLRSAMWPETVWNPSWSSTVRSMSTVSLLELNTAMIGLPGSAVGAGPELSRLIPSFPTSSGRSPHGILASRPVKGITRRWPVLEVAARRSSRSADSTGEAGHHRHQLARLDRFRYVEGEAGHQAADPVFWTAVRGHGDRGRLAALVGLECADPPDERVTILSRHLDVGHEHVGVALLEHREGLAPARAAPHLRPRAHEDLPGEVHRDQVVVHHQD